MKLSTFFTVPIGVSARHVHLSREHIRILFASDLHPDRHLTQTGEFAAHERVSLVTTSGALHRVRILGPPRNQTQVEISRTDSMVLGLPVPVRLSGDISGTPGLTLVGPKGSVQLLEGVIIAARHLHIAPMESARYGLVPGQKIRIVCGKSRRMIFDEVVVRVSDTATLEFHIDTDEANAADVVTGDKGDVIRPEVNATDHNDSTYICVEDIMTLIRQGKVLTIGRHQRITPAALELAKSKGILQD